MSNNRTLSRLVFLVVALAALFAYAAQAGAQAKTAHSKQAAAKAEPGKAAPVSPEKPATEASGPHAKAEFEGETKQESEAAEKEGGEETAFKESPTVKAIGGKLGLSPTQSYWAFVILNFVIIALALPKILSVILTMFAGRPLSMGSVFRERTSDIKRGMEEARKASADAGERLSRIEARLAKLDGEIAEMTAATQQAAQAEEARLQAASEEERKKILESAEQEIAAAAAGARRELKSYAAELAVALAEKRINVDTATDRMLLRDFMDSLAGGKSGQN